LKKITIELEETTFSTRSVVKTESFELDINGIKFKNGFISKATILSILLNENNL